MTEWALAKLTLASMSLISAYFVYYQIPENKYRRDLKRIFIAGGFYTEKLTLGLALSTIMSTKSKPLDQQKGVRIYPKIHKIYYKDDKYYLVFSIPFGVNPKYVLENEWLFKQKFGENIELTNEGKKFVLTIMSYKLPSKFNYDYSKLDLEGKKIPIVAGMSNKGLIVYDMADYPHLLIAGETGSGKSTQLRAIITTLIQCLSPNQLELYLADLKRSEFHIFRRVKHVKKVMLDEKELYKELLKIKKEMTIRGDLLDQWELSHIDEYNRLAEDKKPYIMLFIDEYSLLKKNKNVNEIVEEISSIGRALGIFLVLSMQRPDAEVLGGKLKNNLTIRMAFRHSDGVNSRITISDVKAADIKINERGRMYLKVEDIILVQAPLLELEEAKKILEDYKTPRENTKYMGEVQQEILGVLENEKA